MTYQTAFISYKKSVSQGEADNIHQRLERLGVNVFYDIDALKLGEKWEARLERELIERDALIVILAPQTLLESEWVRREVKTALTHSKKIIPVLTKGYKLSRTAFIESEQLREIIGLAGFQGIEFEYEIADYVVERIAKELKIKGIECRRITISVSVTFMSLLFAFLALFPESTRTSVFISLGLISASPTPTLQTVITPTATYTPSNTPQSTNTSELSTTASTLTETPTQSPTPIPLGYTGNEVENNSQWQEKVRKIFSQSHDGIELSFDIVFVPAGCYVMGRADSQYTDESPISNRQCFHDPFWIDRTEVTWGTYIECVNAGICSNTAVSMAPGTARQIDLPVTVVTWAEAKTYCQSRGGDLPTEAEWEYAARGPSGLKYPWGADFISDYAIYNALSPSMVGSLPQASQSWVGAMDMLGNVQEWMNTIYRPYPYNSEDGRESDDDTDSQRVVRGGAWSYLGNIYSARRNQLAPARRWHDTGFRCAYPNTIAE